MCPQDLSFCFCNRISPKSHVCNFTSKVKTEKEEEESKADQKGQTGRRVLEGGQQKKKKKKQQQTGYKDTSFFEINV